MNVFLGTALAPNRLHRFSERSRTQKDNANTTSVPLANSTTVPMHHVGAQKPRQNQNVKIATESNGKLSSQSSVAQHNESNRDGSIRDEEFDWRATGIVVRADWFAPTERSEIVGNASAVDEFDRWIKEWRYANGAPADNAKVFADRLPARCIGFVRGPSGVGKRVTVDSTLRKYGYTNIIHIDAGGMRTEDLIGDRLVPLLMNATPRRAIVVEEVDGLNFVGGSNANATDPLVRFLNNDAHKVRWGSGLKERTMARGGLAKFMPFYDQVAEERFAAGKSGCVTSCPVVLMASDHQYQFVFKTLERLCGTNSNREGSAFFLFRPVRTEDVERRYAQLSARYNLYTRAKNVQRGGDDSGGQSSADWLVLHDLANVAGGDMRKAVALLVATVRRAYADKQSRQCRGKDADCSEKRLVLRRRHCEALLKCQVSVQTSPFQACSFLLHDCPSAQVAIEHVAHFRMNNVPDMLFGGFQKITPIAKQMTTQDTRRFAKAKPNIGPSMRDVQDWNDLAALVRLADVADIYSRGDNYRQRSDYLSNEATQQVYHDVVTTWSFLLLNFESNDADGYRFAAPNAAASTLPSSGAKSSASKVDAAASQASNGGSGLLQKRQFCRNFLSCRRKDCNCRWMQNSSLTTQRGQRAQWHRMTIEERNQYDQMTEQKMQSSADRFLYFRNYVNSVEQVRARNQHLGKMGESGLIEKYDDDPDGSAPKAKKRKTVAKRAK